LAEVELAVMEEGREWMRQEMQKRLHRLADQDGESPPLGQRRLTRTRQRALSIETCAGQVQVRAAYGQDSLTGQWTCPTRPKISTC
jgi:hypothetical protein